VFGVGFAGLTQLVAILVAALIAVNLNSAAWYEFSPAVAGVLGMSVTPGFFAITVLFFAFGFFSFAFILAGFACTVSRMEELNNIVIIPTLLAVAAFYVAIMGSMTPDMAYVRVTSLVPLLSPMVMMVRLSVTTVPTWEILVACAVNIATILFSGLVCARIYRVGVMLYGNKPKLRDIVRLAFK
jgi:ABC-2 type transport system permease protein